VGKLGIDNLRLMSHIVPNIPNGGGDGAKEVKSQIRS